MFVNLQYYVKTVTATVRHETCDHAIKYARSHTSNRRGARLVVPAITRYL